MGTGMAGAMQPQVDRVAFERNKFHIPPVALNEGPDFFDELYDFFLHGGLLSECRNVPQKPPNGKGSASFDDAKRQAERGGEKNDGGFVGESTAVHRPNRIARSGIVAFDYFFFFAAFFAGFFAAFLAFAMVDSPPSHLARQGSQGILNVVHRILVLDFVSA